MYFAQHTENLDLTLYLTLLSQVIEENNKGFEDLFQEIVVEAHKLSKGEIDQYHVRNEIYDIVDLLVKSNAEYFKGVKPDSIDKRVYQTIQDFLKSMNESQDLYLM